MAGELTPMPLQDILAAVGFKTATGDWPPGFDVAHAVLTLISITERLRLSIAAHHDEIDHRLDAVEVEGPCPICVSAQGAAPEDVLTDTVVPRAPFCGRTDLDPHRPHHWRRKPDGSYGDYDDEGEMVWCPGNVAPDMIPESMRGRPDDNELTSVGWCGERYDGIHACTRPARHPGLHYSSDGGWG